MKAEEKIKNIGAANTGPVRNGSTARRKIRSNPTKGGKIAGNWMDRKKGK